MATTGRFWPDCSQFSVLWCKASQSAPLCCLEAGATKRASSAPLGGKREILPGRTHLQRSRSSHRLVQMALEGGMILARLIVNQAQLRLDP
jgi:hypothetical protein